MQSKEDAIHIAIFAAVDLAALLANALLIAAILKRAQHGNDRQRHVGGITAVARLKVVDSTVYFVFAGPCTLLGAKFCNKLIFVYASSIAHSTVILFISFCFRMLGQASIIKTTQTHNSPHVTVVDENEQYFRIWKESTCLEGTVDWRTSSTVRIIYCQRRRIGLHTRRPPPSLEFHDHFTRASFTRDQRAATHCVEAPMLWCEWRRVLAEVSQRPFVQRQAWDLRDIATA
ncbi:hypothetical protein PRIPAC_81028 [Pristionchus pacificus]|uniref:G protein-coupled receptor n=1 Tax=Pristionchus pacificus TaxID=54126 RepID=A0A2A6CJH7_PRIPA|nr:hypothetical protein PRIPAC_81028 [Pristionchus pacificus]|eukprot:PDM78171.1 G protein-coupled receptor [Pristionchus pacificus]